MKSNLFALILVTVVTASILSLLRKLPGNPVRADFPKGIISPNIPSDELTRPLGNRPFPPVGLLSGDPIEGPRSLTIDIQGEKSGFYHSISIEAAQNNYDATMQHGGVIISSDHGRMSSSQFESLFESGKVTRLGSSQRTIKVAWSQTKCWHTHGQACAPSLASFCQEVHRNLLRNAGMK